MSLFTSVKKSVKKIMLVLLGSWLVLISVPVLAGDIPLQKAIDKGIAMDAGNANFKLAWNQAQLDTEKARLQKRFTVSAAGSYRFQSDRMQISMPDIMPAPGIVIPGTRIDAGSKHNYDLKLAITQPIYTGGVLSGAVDINSHAAALQKLNVSLRKVQVTGNIKSSYFTYRLLERKKNSLRLLKKNLELHNKRLEDYYREELVKKTDLLETRIKITETQMNIEQLQRKMKEEKIHFKRLTSFDIDNIETEYIEEAAGFKDSFGRFNARHPALKQFRRQIKIQEQQKKIMAGNYKPQVMGFAQLHYGKPGIDFFKNQWSLYFQGGFDVSMKLFDWHRLRKDKQIADAAIDRLRNREKDFIDNVRKQMEQLYARKRSLKKQLEQARQLAEMATEDAGLKKDLYDENQAANVDYLSALLTTQRYRSMQRELDARVQLVNAGINMLVGEQ